MRLGGAYATKLLYVGGLLLLIASPFADVTQAKTRVEANIFYPEAIQNPEAIKSLEQQLGVSFTAAKWYLDWGTGFEASTAQAFHANGYLPELTWEPQINNVGVSYSAVVAGSHDSYLTQTAQAIKSLGFPIRISLAPEMNTDWTPWGIGQHGNNRDNHKAFWRHVVQLFRNIGATNVTWVWSPNVEPWNAAQLYGTFGDIYPGDTYVDYLGLDGYNWGTSQPWSEWQSFSEVFSASYHQLTAVSQKNILIMEMASTEAGGSKAAWISDMFSQLQTSFPRIVGFTWFHINKETDWRITSSSEAMASFSRGFNGTAPPTVKSPTKQPAAPTLNQPTHPTDQPANSTSDSSTMADTSSIDPDTTFVTTSAITPKIAGSLIASERFNSPYNPNPLWLVVALSFGVTAIFGLFHRRLRLLQVHHLPALTPPLSGIRIVDSVYCEHRHEKSFSRRHLDS